MAKTKKDKLNLVLTKFMQVGLISTVGITSNKGLLITAIMLPHMNELIVGALCSTILASAKTLSSKMKTGKVIYCLNL